MGAIAAGLTYFAGYPITPASDILEWLSAKLPQVGGLTIQCEDEIASLCSVLGASYTGAKAMTATSGPGLSLMTEVLGYAGTAEIPCVIIDAQRGGPSTGLPTKTEQSDLQHALYGGHGEAPRVVIAPITVEDCFWATIDAFNYSERFQVPVILLTDQGLATRMEVIHKPDTSKVELWERRTSAGLNGDYKRYELHRRLGLADGDPGRGGRPVRGHRHRARRVRPPGLHARDPHGDADQALGQAGAARQRPRPPRALRRRAARHRGHRLRLHLRARPRGRRPRCASAGCRWARSTRGCSGPFPAERVKQFAANATRVVVPEVNFTGQLARLVRAECGLQVESHPKCDGLPFTAEDIQDLISERITQLSTDAAKRKPSDYKSDLKPIWCPGCGDFGVLASLYRAFARARPRPAPAPSSSRASAAPAACRASSSTYGFHSLHGRPLPVAMGVKLANPELNVIAVGGDGDGFAIGAGHFPHAARRNVDITYLVMDNEIYGLTKGQVSPTSLTDQKAPSTPWGNLETPLNTLAFAVASGASFVARGASFNTKALTELIVQAMEHSGFSYIDALSPCVMFNNHQEEWKETVTDVAPDHDVTDKVAAFDLALRGGFKLGILYREQRATLNEKYRLMIDAAKDERRRTRCSRPSAPARARRSGSRRSRERFQKVLEGAATASAGRSARSRSRSARLRNPRSRPVPRSRARCPRA